jgi:flagellar hook-length control protein FliK
MSNNIALANLPVAAVPRQQETASGKSFAIKKDSTGGSLHQTESQDISAAAIKDVSDGTASSKTQKKTSFNELLLKRLTHDASGEKNGTSQHQKQVTENIGFTNEKQKSDSKEKKETANPSLVAAWFTPQTLEASKNPTPVTFNNVKSLSRNALKPVQSAQSEVVQNPNPSVGAEVANKKITTESSKDVTAVSKKTARETTEIKNASPATQAEKQSPNAVYAGPAGNVAQKTVALKDSRNSALSPSGEANIEVTTKTSPVTLQVKTQHVQEKIKAEESSLSEPKTKIKASVSQKEEQHSSKVVQAEDVESRPDGIIQPMVSSRSIMEPTASSSVLATGVEKTAVQQAFLKPSEQVIDTIRSTDVGLVQQIRVVLSPVELGTVRITFRQQEGQMEGLLEVQNPEVRKDMEKALPQITAALAQNGIQIRRMEIAPMPNQQQSNPEADQSMNREFSSPEQQYLAEQGNSGLSRGSQTGVGRQDIGQDDLSQSATQQVYDLSRMNMYA